MFGRRFFLCGSGPMVMRDRWDLNPRPSGVSTFRVPEPDVLSWLSSLLLLSDLDYGPIWGFSSKAIKTSTQNSLVDGLVVSRGVFAYRDVNNVGRLND